MKKNIMAILVIVIFFSFFLYFMLNDTDYEEDVHADYYSELNDEKPIYYLKDGWHILPSVTKINDIEWAYYEDGRELKRLSYMIYTHRGWDDAPENSLASFIMAKENGYLGIETDIRFTKDNVPVLCHDSKINRVARNNDLTEISDDVLIKDKTYDELMNDYIFNVSRDGRVLEQYNNNRITKFEDALQYVKENKMTMEIELKSGTDEQIESLVKMVQDYDMDNVVLWTSFHKNQLLRVNKYDDDELIKFLVESSTTYTKEELEQIYQELKTENNNVYVPNVSDSFLLRLYTLNMPEKTNQYPVEDFVLNTIPTSIIATNQNNIGLIINNNEIIKYTYTGDGNISCLSSDESCVKCSVNQEKQELVINPIKYTDKNITITLRVSQGINYSYTSELINVYYVGEITSNDNDTIISDNQIEMKIPYNYTLTISELRNKVNIRGNVVIKNASGNTVTDNNSVLGTGSKIVLSNNEYIIIVDGDVNKDGKITALDYIAIRNHMMKERIIDSSSIEYKAADMNKDGNISVLDYINIRKIMMGENEAVQYTVTFNTSGGNSIESVKVNAGNKVIRPSDPIKEDYIFKEWQLNGKEYDFNNPINDDITLNAIWELDSDVPFLADGTINNAYYNIIKDGSKDSGLLNSHGINNAILDASANGIKNIKLEQGNYYVTAAYDILIGSTVRKYAVIAKNNVNLNLNNSTLTLVENSEPRYAIVLIKDVNNFKIYNGVIEGDRLLHTCESDGTLLSSSSNNRCNNDTKVTHEWGHCIQVRDSQNINVENIDISMCTGDGLTTSISNNINVINNNIHYIRRNGISIISGDYITIKNNEIHDIIGTNPQAGIDIEKDSVNQLYNYITIENNKIYNTVTQSIDIFNKIYHLTIKNNELSSTIFTRVKPRKSLDSSDSDEFPTNVDDAYLMDKYDIVISGNKVISSNIPIEHGTYNIDATTEKINTLNYKGYISVKYIRETNNVNEYNLKVKDTKTIPVTWAPTSPTYKLLTYESSDTAIAKVSTSGKITAVSEGTATITVRATDYGKEPNTDSDDKIYSFEINVNVTEE